MKDWKFPFIMKHRRLPNDTRHGQAGCERLTQNRPPKVPGVEWLSHSPQGGIHDDGIVANESDLNVEIVPRF